MSVDQLRVSIICGGQSPEHEISILSARNVAKELLAISYQVDVIYITRDGVWQWLPVVYDFVEHGMEKMQGIPLVLTPGNGKSLWQRTDAPQVAMHVDVVFPLVHGVTGEDGCLQGVLQILGVPYVGAGVLGSAMAMHKDIAKRLWRAQSLPTCDWMSVTAATRAQYDFSMVVRQFGDDVFVKSAGQGSSIGVSKVSTEKQFEQAMDLAFSFGDCVIIEPVVDGREIECSVLGYQDDIRASLPGELIVHHDFYSYAAKYIDPHGATTQIPAELSPQQLQDVQHMAVQAYRAVCCQGMARVDFFVNEEGIWLNELNTLPGFTDISLYPLNWQATGMPMAELLTSLIDAAMVDFARRQIEVAKPMTVVPNKV